MTDSRHTKASMHLTVSVSQEWEEHTGTCAFLTPVNAQISTSTTPQAINHGQSHNKNMPNVIQLRLSQKKPNSKQKNFL